jgi:ribonuclease HI
LKGYLFSDGGARGNPGPSGAAAVLYDEKKLIDFNGKFFDHSTNNIAEYNGLIIGLKIAHKNKISHLTCYLDSELIVKQLNGEYKIKSPELQKLKAKVDDLKEFLESICFEHIPREQNHLADKLVNLILDTKLSL